MESQASPHQPLEEKQYRLLVLLLGKDSMPLECMLQPLFLDTPPQYEALSYTWGRPTGPFEEPKYARNQRPEIGLPLLRVISESQTGNRDDVTRGRPGMRAIPLQPNLEQALRHLRLPDRERPLWIDATCIN
jgi:hypothetical protein